MLPRALATTDVDIARTEVGRLFCPHRLRPLSGRVQLRLNARTGAGVRAVELDYGQAVRIDPGTLDRFYLVQVPLAGRALIAHGGKEFTSTPTVASVLSPDDPVSMIWGPGNPQLLCWIDRTAVDTALAELAGDRLTPVRFTPMMNLSTPSAARWLASLRRHARTPGATTESSLIAELLVAQPHNHSDRLAPKGPTPTAVRRAVAFMEDHVAEVLTMTDIAAATGVGVRALQKGFRAELDTTPMEWLRDLRLDRAQARLLAARPAQTTVTQVAGALGIQHLGRFAVHYRERFGESPSHTLARVHPPTRVHQPTRAHHPTRAHQPT